MADPNGDVLATLISRFNNKRTTDMGEGDYADMLWAMMHAQNNGASPQDITNLVAGVSDNRRKAMLDTYNGVATSDPFVQADNQNLHQLLNRFSGSGS